MKKLISGDRVIFEQKGRKLRAVVIDAMALKARGEELLVPVIRPSVRRSFTCPADRDGKKFEPKVRWIKRSLLRKLP